MRKYLESIIYLLVGLTVFLLPLQTRFIWRLGEIFDVAWEYGTLSLYINDLFIFVFFLVSFVCLAFGGVFYFDKAKKSSRIFLWAFIFLIYVFLSIVWSSDNILAFYKFLFFGQVIGFGVLVARFKISQKFIFSMVALSGFWQALWGIKQIWFQSQSASKWLGVSALDPKILGVSVIEYARYVPDIGDVIVVRFLRAHGGLPHPNIFGGFLAVALIAVAVLYIDSRIGTGSSKEETSFLVNAKNFLKEKKRIHNLVLFCISLKKYVHIFWMFSFVVICFGLWLSFSRSSWIAVIIGLIVLWFGFCFSIKEMSFEFRSRIRNGFIHLIIAFFISFAVCILLLPYVFITRFGFGQSVQRLEHASVSERIDSYQDFFYIFKANSLLGVGVGNYTVELKESYPDRSSYRIQPVHNFYALLIGELGFVGFVYFVLFFYIRFRDKRIRRFCVSDFDVSMIFKYGLFSIICVLAVVGLFDHYLWTSHTGVLLWWLMFLL